MAIVLSSFHGLLQRPYDLHRPVCIQIYRPNRPVNSWKSLHGWHNPAPSNLLGAWSKHTAHMYMWKIDDPQWDGYIIYIYILYYMYISENPICSSIQDINNIMKPSWGFLILLILYEMTWSTRPCHAIWEHNSSAQMTTHSCISTNHSQPIVLYYRL